MYILIFEDSSIIKTSTITEGDKDAADMGILDVIDTKTLKQYYEGEWHDLAGYETEAE